MIKHFIVPSVLDGNDVFVKFALVYKVASGGISLSLSPTAILDSSGKRQLRCKVIMELDRTQKPVDSKSIKLSRLEKRGDTVVVKVFISGFGDTSSIFKD